LEKNNTLCRKVGHPGKKHITNGTANIDAAADISEADADANVCNGEAHGHQREVSLADRNFYDHS
jgi:hypothetical protein